MKYILIFSIMLYMGVFSSVSLATDVTTEKAIECVDLDVNTVDIDAELTLITDVEHRIRSVDEDITYHKYLSDFSFISISEKVLALENYHKNEINTILKNELINGSKEVLEPPMFINQIKPLYSLDE